jgi:hypothetical protein
VVDADINLKYAVAGVGGGHDRESEFADELKLDGRDLQ